MMSDDWWVATNHYVLQHNARLRHIIRVYRPRGIFTQFSRLYTLYTSSACLLLFKVAKPEPETRAFELSWVRIFVCGAELAVQSQRRRLTSSKPETAVRLPTDLREPRQTQSPSLSLITHGSSSSSSPSSRSPLASSLTRSVFYSELKTWLFSKSFPP